MAAPASVTHRGWFWDKENTTLDLYFGTGGASDPTEVLRVNASGITHLLAETLNGNLTIADDILLGIGTGNTARLSWDTTDANANALLLQMPAGGVVDVPVLAIGQSIESVDLGLFNGVVDPTVAMFGVGAVTTAPRLRVYKARGTIASPTVVTTGDDLFSIDAYGAVAAGEYVQAARILFEMTGTIATTRGPGTITFLTATDAAPSVLTQALQISAAQLVTMATGASTGDFKLNLTLTAGADGVGANGEQLTSGGAAAATSWTAAASLREFKNVERERTDAAAALRLLLDTPVYDFKYKRKDESKDRITTTGDVETIYTGVMADEAPWAMHHSGRILNPVNALGYTVLGFKALAAEVNDLRKQVMALKKERAA